VRLTSRTSQPRQRPRSHGYQRRVGRSGRPERSPVIVPSARTTPPLTMTWVTPSAYWSGFGSAGSRHRCSEDHRREGTCERHARPPWPFDGSLPDLDRHPPMVGAVAGRESDLHRTFDNVNLGS